MIASIPLPELVARARTARDRIAESLPGLEVMRARILEFSAVPGMDRQLWLGLAQDLNVLADMKRDVVAGLDAALAEAAALEQQAGEG